MKIISWNCQGAFRKKADFILEEHPDILVIQECEHPDKLKFKSTTQMPSDIYWHSDGGKKGIGIFSYSDYTIKVLPEFNPIFRYIIPLRISKKDYSFTLLAVWAMDNKENHHYRYIGQVWNAINHYKDLLNSSIIIIGDFNSNKIWDYKDRVGNHTDVVNSLAEKNIHSLYHSYFNYEQGKELHPTFFLYRKLEKPYHIDYCFVSADILEFVKHVEIGAYDKWTVHSDHSPLCISLDL